MKLGKVTGEVNVRQTKHSPELGRVLLVEMEGSAVAAMDQAEAKPGDQVLVVMGHAASRYSMETPVDAVIMAVVQELGVDKTGTGKI